MNKIVVVLVLMIAFSLAVIAGDKKETAKEKGGITTLKGYVVDASCAKDMAGKEDVMTKAANHTKKCALEEMCASSGYGVFSDGKWYKFDEAGDKQAKELIEKTTKTKEIAVEVKGKKGDGNFAVTSIKEQKGIKAEKKTKKSKS
jgi:hypothetical protein